MSTGLDTSPSAKRAQWFALVAALLGWMFDGLEMGLFPLVARPALGDLLRTQDEKLIIRWLAVITAVFLIGAATGGVLFGWLGDRIGRVRAMTLSIFTYALFSGLCGLATEVWQVAGLRFMASLGMGGEWSLGVALVMEVWPNSSRAWLAGVIGAAANFGYMLIAVVGIVLKEISTDVGRLLIDMGLSSETKDQMLAWRLLMLFGAFPALLTFLTLLYVPESPRWQAEKKRGATSHWETSDLLGVLIGAAAACGMILLLAADIHWLVRIVGSLAAFVIVLLGYLYPIRRYLERHGNARGAMGAGKIRENFLTLRRMLLGAALSGVALLATWGTTQQAPTWVSSLPNGNRPEARAYTQMLGAIGAVIGCVLASLSGARFGRRKTYFFLCLFAMCSIFGLYRLNHQFGTSLLVWAFISGAITASFYGWLPLYLPELFTTRVRATGQGFSYNFGRVLAAIGVMQLPIIMTQLDVGYDTACPAISLIYVIGMIMIWLAPETKGKPLPEDEPDLPA